MYIRFLMHRDINGLKVAVVNIKSSSLITYKSSCFSVHFDIAALSTKLFIDTKGLVKCQCYLVLFS